MTHYDITIGNDVARDVHCDIIMGHDVAIGTYHDVTMHTDVELASLFMYYYTQLWYFYFLSKIFKNVKF